MNDGKYHPELTWIETVSRWMDDVFVIPGTNIKFGIDPLLGLIPFIGDLISYIISLTMIITMIRHGLSSKLILKMLGNITLDYLISSVPILGDIFDFGFKANKKNLALLKTHLSNTGSSNPKIGVVILLFLATFMMMSIMTFYIWKGAAYWYQWLGSVS